MARQPSPHRAALAELQAELAAILADIAKLTADEDAATTSAIEARAAVDATGTDIAAACPRKIVRRRMSGLPPELGDAPPPPPDLAEKLYATAEHLTAALAHRDTIRASPAAAESEHDRLTAAIDTAAMAVVRADPGCRRLSGGWTA